MILLPRKRSSVGNRERFRCSNGHRGLHYRRSGTIPRSLDVAEEKRASLHAKCVVVDRKHVFISSANFTEAAQERNVEVGRLVHSPNLGEQLTRYFETLISQGRCSQSSSRG